MEQAGGSHFMFIDSDDYVDPCMLEETLRIPGARAGLDRGYRLKVGLYRRAPGLYLFLYHMLKSR